jgi:hypothetical protein
MEGISCSCNIFIRLKHWSQTSHPIPLDNLDNYFLNTYDMIRCISLLVMSMGICNAAWSLAPWLGSHIPLDAPCPTLDPQDGSKWYNACNMIQNNTGFQLYHPFSLGPYCRMVRPRTHVVTRVNNDTRYPTVTFELHTDTLRKTGRQPCRECSYHCNGCKAPPHVDLTTCH